MKHASAEKQIVFDKNTKLWKGMPRSKQTSLGVSQRRYTIKRIQQLQKKADQIYEKIDQLQKSLSQSK